MSLASGTLFLIAKEYPNNGYYSFGLIAITESKTDSI